MPPITVITGFLGAGKTTLVHGWLAEFARGEIAVVVNEQGDVGVDGELLADRVKTLVEITGGCVCCSTQGELVRALEKLASHSPPFVRILVETSGAASPIGVLRALAAGGGTGTLSLDGVVTVVDATRVAHLAEHDLAIEQIGCADVVVLSRTDSCDAETLARARGIVACQNGAALVVGAARGQLTDPDSSTLEALLARRHTEFPKREWPTSSSHAGRPYESVSLAIEGSVDGERFADYMETELSRFSGRLFRTKGILGVDGMDQRMIVQGVADLVEITFGAPWGAVAPTSRLVIVGFGLDREALAKGFAECVAGAIPREE